MKNTEIENNNIEFLKVKLEDFLYKATVKFINNKGIAKLYFRSETNKNIDACYAVDLDIENNTCKLYRLDGSIEYLLSDNKPFIINQNEEYNVKIIAIKEWILLYLNNILIASTGDYTLTKEDKGQKASLNSGYLAYQKDKNIIIKNLIYIPIDNHNNPALSSIKINTKNSLIEEKIPFNNYEPIKIQYVPNIVNNIKITTDTNNKNTIIRVKNKDGKIYEKGKNIPINIGVNYITIESTIIDDDIPITLTYRVNIHRLEEEKIYYKEQYRNQYHYSVKEGWANDPNGLVFYNGTYHLFYQFYDDIIWGPMHWAHATSKDLIHWKEQPIALYPDANGTMFSGCIVVDDKNTSGLFDEKGGLVAFITCNGNGQRMKIAYSVDEGKTWNKLNKIILDWTDDPLLNKDFRDPKVFRWENKWFMILAGGPLRLYSSDNLIDWKCESTYKDINTECPDIYPIKTKEGIIKWILSRGGRFYKVGNLVKEKEAWKFIPDKDYEVDDGIMNFGKDSYAAMTFYEKDFGTIDSPTIPDIYEINWMNTWEDYCNKVATTVNQKFNGTFNLVLRLGLIKEKNKYLLTQTPIDNYKKLRKKEIINKKNIKVSAINSLLNKFSYDSYEIISTFYPSKDTTKIGYKLRVGKNNSTNIIYNIKKQEISIDRSNSGIILSDCFKEINHQNVTTNEDGSISLRIYVDRASIEVFTKDYSVCGANQIFPFKNSKGLFVYADNDTCIDIVIYQLNSIWNKNN